MHQSDYEDRCFKERKAQLRKREVSED